MSNTKSASMKDEEGTNCIKLYVSYIYSVMADRFGGQVISFPINRSINPDTVKDQLFKVDSELRSAYRLEILAWSEVKE